MKAIVTTTINPPTTALGKFMEKKDWHVIVVGDLKTPHEEYQSIKNITYLHPEEQEARWKMLSDLIGWRCIQRRNFGFLAAYEMGAEIVATVDDDNIPYDNWGEDLICGQNVEVDVYTGSNFVFEPLSVTNQKQLWHRGYPWEMLKTRHDVTYLGKQKVFVKVQAGLWDGDPDIDAVERLTMGGPLVKFNHFEPFHPTKLTVFNSQNTFIHRSALKNYMMIPFVGRMDDIWGSYLLQKLDFSANVVFSRASVYQDRNQQNLFKNMQNEMIGYENNLNFVSTANPIPLMPETSQKAFEEYRKLFV